MKIWTNTKFPHDVTEMLLAQTKPNELVFAEQTSSLNLVNAPPDQRLIEADIAFGQPDANQLLQLKRLKWVHLTTAGYTAYDRSDLRESFQTRGVALTTSSGVYDEPCAQHVLAMMMAFARQLPQSWADQSTRREWPAAHRRANSFLLKGQHAALCGYGAIGRRLGELLSPFSMRITGLRRTPSGKESMRTLPITQLEEILPDADHVINLLPANADSHQRFGAKQFELMKPTAYFYNIGRGSTVDEKALEHAIQSGSIAGAYLDVTLTEPLPSDHPLWAVPNCFITPHSAGGFREEMASLVNHFLENLRRFQADDRLLNRVV
jgi:phosphoglycerate dehydrogenase-like enzyme